MTITDIEQMKKEGWIEDRKTGNLFKKTEGVICVPISIKYVANEEEIYELGCCDEEEEKRIKELVGVKR